MTIKFKYKRILCFLLLIILFGLSLPLCVSADSAKITLSATEINIGDTLTLTVEYFGDNDIFGTDFYLDFNSDILKYTGGADGVVENTLRFVNANCYGAFYEKVTATFEAIASGRAQFCFTGYVDGKDSGKATVQKFVKVNGDNSAAATENSGGDSQLQEEKSSTAYKKRSENNEEKPDTTLNSIGEIPLKSATGFDVVKTEYKGETVDCLKDKSGKYLLYYIFDKNGSGGFYTLAENGDFIKQNCIIIANDMYIAEDFEASRIPEGFLKTELYIDDCPVPVCKSKNDAYSDYYLLYCYYNGKSDFYCYDSVLHTIDSSAAFPNRDYDNGRENRKTILTVGVATLITAAIIGFFVFHYKKVFKKVKTVKNNSPENKGEFDEITVTEKEP